MYNYYATYMVFISLEYIIMNSLFIRPRFIIFYYKLSKLSCAVFMCNVFLSVSILFN